jgi:hypothetical protein
MRSTRGRSTEGTGEARPVRSAPARDGHRASASRGSNGLGLGIAKRSLQRRLASGDRPTLLPRPGSTSARRCPVLPQPPHPTADGALCLPRLEERRHHPLAAPPLRFRRRARVAGLRSYAHHAARSGEGFGPLRRPVRSSGPGPSRWDRLAHPLRGTGVSRLATADRRRTGPAFPTHPRSARVTGYRVRCIS